MENKIKNYYKINEVEKLTGVPRSTIHFYLREGLLHPPIKTSLTMSYYDDEHIERITLIQKMKNDLKIPISYIKERLSSHLKEYQSHPDFMADLPDNSNHLDGVRNKRKNEIIDAAIKIFSNKGFYKTKVKDITDSLEISTGTFYIYFKNKEELFIEAIAGIVENILGSAREAIKNEDDFVMRLVLRGRVFFEKYSKYAEIMNQLRAEMTRDSEFFQNRVKQIYHELTKPIITELQTAMDKGLIRKTDPDLLAYGLTGLIETMSFRMTVDNSYTFDKIQLFLIDLLTNGLPLFKDAQHEKKVISFVSKYKKSKNEQTMPVK
ncbi:MAG: MerR family transcriptional regulator [Proteobacteria bacterium]|nr:MerR family transcriptional regulator [Pseudomonadota bacterium]